MNTTRLRIFSTLFAAITFAVSLLPLMANANVLAPTFQQIQFQNLDPEILGIHPAITSIVQDKSGFMWFGTQDGLGRFDGVNVKHYYTSKAENRRISGNRINHTFVTTNGELYIATNTGIDTYNYQTQSFSSLNDSVEGLPKREYLNIVETSPGVLWFITRDQGVFSYNENDKHLMHFSHENKEINTFPSASILHASRYKNESLLLVTKDAGVIVFSPDVNGFTPFRDLYETLGSQPAIINLFVTRSNEIVSIATDGTTSIANLDTNAVEQVPASFCGKEVTTFYEANNGKLWFGTDKGLCGYDKTTTESYLYQYQPHQHSSLTDNRVTNIYQDAGDVIWIGTMNGVSKWNDSVKNLTHITDASVIANKRVTSFAHDGVNEHHYIGTLGGGFSQINSKTGDVINVNQANSPLLPDNDVMALSTSHNGDVWVGTSSSGLLQFSSDLQLKRHWHETDSPFPITSNAITKIIQLRNNNVAVATMGGGVNIIDDTGNAISYRAEDNNNSSISSDRVLDIIEDSEGRLWVATLDGGINAIEPMKSGKVTSFLSLSQEHQKLIGEDVFALHESGDYLWLGTKAKGLIHIEKSSFFKDDINMSFVTAANGLPSDVIYGIIPLQDSIWISHARGLSRVETDKLTVSNFTSAQGAQGGNYTRGAFFKDRHGYLFFGGANGFNVFNPSALGVNDYRAPLKLVGIEVGDTALSSTQVMSDSHPIEIDYNDRFLNLEFALLDFTLTEKNTYRYRIKGLSDRLIEQGNSGVLHLSNLPHGNYVINVFAKNNDGIDAYEQLDIPIRVNPPPWLTLWAYGIYVLAALAIIALIHRHYQQKLRAQWKYQKALKRRVSQRAKALKESNENLLFAIQEKDKANAKAEKARYAKSEFIKKISHEIRTPLNSILGMSELLFTTDLDRKQRDYTKNLNSAGNLLLDLSNDILDFSKLESNNMKVEPIDTDLYALVENAIHFFKSKAKANNVKLNIVISDKSTHYVRVDSNKVRQILVNLISNAVKFTNDGDVYCCVECAQNILKITVRDTGIGMSKEQSDNVFTAFEHVDNSMTKRYSGTGLGLSITKSLTELLNGKIKVTSIEGKGSTFEVSIPTKPVVEESEVKLRSCFSDMSIYMHVTEQVTQQSLMSLLERNGFAVEQGLPATKPKCEHQIVFIEARLATAELVDKLLIEVDAKVVILSESSSKCIAHLEPNTNIAYFAPPFTYMQLVTTLEGLIKEGTLVTKSNAMNWIKQHRFDARILLVDDQQVNTTVALAMCELLGLTCDIANNGIEAIERCSEKHYDLIFMDCHMPLMDGFSASKSLRKIERDGNYPQKPIIAMTAGFGQDYASECKEAGMDNLLTKPYTLESLLAMLQQYLSDFVRKREEKQEIVASTSKSIMNDLRDADAQNQSIVYVNKASVEPVLAMKGDDGESVYVQISQMFFDEMAVFSSLFSDDRKPPTFDYIVEKAHALKSMAGNVGATLLFEQLQRLEKAANNQDIVACMEEISEIEHTFDATKKEMNRIIEKVVNNA